MKFAFCALSSLMCCTVAYGGLLVSGGKPSTNKEEPTESKKEEPAEPMIEKRRCASDWWCMEKGRFDIWGEYLYWQVREDQLSYAEDVKGLDELNAIISGGGNINSITAKFKVRDTSFEWKSGWRIGAGYSLPCNSWDFQAYWTHLHMHTNSDLNDPDFGVLPTQTPLIALIAIIADLSATPPTFALLEGAKNKFHFEYDTVDFEIGKGFFPGKTVQIRPFIGVKAAWIDQHMTTDYEGFGGGSVSTTTIPMLGIQLKKRNEFTAIGPSFGLDSDWKFAREWSLASGFGFAFLYGDFDIKINDVLTIPNSTHFIETIMEHDLNRIRPNVNGFIGINWDKCIGKCCILTIGAAYEVQYWWDQWMVPMSIVTGVLEGFQTPHGDLSLHGLDVRAGIAF